LLAARFESNLGGSSVQGTARVQLQSDYPAEANLRFNNVTYAGFQGLVGSQQRMQPGFDALLEGQANLSGMAARVSTLRGEVRFSRAELTTVSVNTKAGKPAKVLKLQNQGPIVARFDNGSVQIQGAHISGPSTDILLAGTVGLDKQAPVNLTMNGEAD